MPSLTHWLQYLALRTVCGVVPCFNVDQNLETAARIGSWYYRASARRRARALENLARCFPDWSPERCEAVAERSLQHFFRLFMVDSMVMPRLVTPSSWTRYVHVRDMEPVLEPIIRNEPALMLSGHHGNWELMNHYLAVIGCPIAAVARPIDNPLVNRYLLSLREVRGARILTKWGVTDELQRLLDNRWRVGFIADQNAGDRGLFVPFFGRLASAYKSIGLLAMRYEIPVCVVAATRVDDRFEYNLSHVDIIQPEDWADQPDPVFYITARYTRALEEAVRRTPDQYMWVHRRWKSRPRFEREGQPMPRRLIERLESLPWMTSDEMDRIQRSSETAV